MYEWSSGIFAKKSKLHDAGGPDTVVSPNIKSNDNDIPVILVSGRFPSSSVGYTVELVNTNGTSICSLPNLPSYRYGHTQTGVTACSSNCQHATYPVCPVTCHTLSTIQHRLLGADPQSGPLETVSQRLGISTRYHVVRRREQQRCYIISDTAGERRHCPCL